MPHIHCVRITLVFCFALIFFAVPFSIGQDISTDAVTPTAAENESEILVDPLRIKVDVQEIRLDVVVLDKDGLQITDLTAEDFEVYQDRRQVNVTSSIYINNQAAAAGAWPSASRKESPYRPNIPAEAPSEENVGRTIVFVVDNLSMVPFAHLYWAKMGINRFLENQMLPGDMVAVMHTGSGNSIINMFSSDKRQISARTSYIPYDPITTGSDISCRVHDAQLLTLAYAIHALKDLPGRKTLLFMSSKPMISNSFEFFTAEYESGGARVLSRENLLRRNCYEVLEKSFRELADRAMQAGVVVHTLNTEGLEHCLDCPAPIDMVNPLSARTGGIYINDNNFFVDGIGKEVNNMMAGYYLVSYIPPPNTFQRNFRGDPIFRSVRVRVKRKGAEVHARTGFYGMGKAEEAVEKHPLQQAIFSPFLYADIGVNMAAGYDKDAKAGYLARTWIHIDPKDVTIAETENGGARIALKTICLTTNVEGVVQDARLEQYVYNIEPEKKAETIAWIQEYGIRFAMLLPVKKPGFYTVRIGVQDMESGRVGSAYQPVEIPDLKKKEPKLSSVFMITGDNDIAWMNADATKELTGGLFFPVMDKDGVRTPALRTYAQGDNLQTLAILYNADAKAVARNDVVIQSVLYKDGVEFLRGEPKPVTGNKTSISEGIPILQKLALGADMPPGDYLLQLLVIDKAVRAKEEKEKGFFSKIAGFYIGDTFVDYNKAVKGVTTQSLSFRVTE